MADYADANRALHATLVATIKTRRAFKSVAFHAGRRCWRGLRIPSFPFVDRWITLTLIHPALVCRKARRARACPGHPRLGLTQTRKTWMGHDEENESVLDEQQLVGRIVIRH